MRKIIIYNYIDPQAINVKYTKNIINIKKLD